jgi:hypothetical protein
MVILFLHGWHSVPGGLKPTYLKEHGHDVINPQLDDDDFDAALKTAQAAYDSHQPDVVVGSSRGGAVALNIDSQSTPLVLLCPAWKNWGSVATLKSNAMILHSRLDDVIPFADSQDLVARSGLPSDTLIEVGNDHRLADEASLSVMLWACRILTSGETIPSVDDDHQRVTSSSTTPEDLSKNSRDASQEASYICDACGEEIVIPLDLSEGNNQRYVEDCPVCCRANVIHVAFDEDGMGQVWAEPEQDYD